jgi:hypothetical protein
MAAVSFTSVTTQAIFNAHSAANKLSTDTLYFVEDTNRVYKGAELFANGLEVISGAFSTVTSPVADKLYFSTSTKEFAMANTALGSGLVVIAKPSTNAIGTTPDGTYVATDKAVADYVSTAVSGGVPDDVVTGLAKKSTDGVTGDTGAIVYELTVADTTDEDLEETKTEIVFPFVRDVSLIKTTTGTKTAQLSVQKNGVAASTYDLGDYVTGVTYDGDTATFTVTHIAGANTTFSIPAENFLSAASYDSTTSKLTLTMNDESTVEVDLSALIEYITASDTTTIDMTLSASHELTAAVRIGTDVTNWLTDGGTSSSGLLVVPKIDTDSADYITVSSTTGAIGLDFDEIWENVLKSKVSTSVTDGTAWQVINALPS